MQRLFLHSGWTALLTVLLAAPASSQHGGDRKPPAAGSEAVITGVKIVYEKGAPAVEVDSTRPVVPTVQMLDSPPRLVIDLANAQMGLPRKRIPVLKENILTIRAEQYQIEPAITRIVVDLLVPYGYTWDAAGNRLMVRLNKPEDINTANQKTSVPQVAALTSVAAGAVVPVTNGVGDFIEAGKAFADGSSLTAGSETAVLRLTRGGEVRICPGTTVSVTPAKGSKNLLLGMSTGSMETHYSLKETADTVLTPDFRILFAGPGEFHYAVSADAHGNTCVRGLKGNTSSAIVYELMGDRIYQVKPSEQLMFHSGRIDQVDGDIPPECGCPPPVPMGRMETTAGKPTPDLAPGTNLTLAQGGSGPDAGPNQNRGGNGSADHPENAGAQAPSSGNEIRPLPPSQPNDVHVDIEAPLVFQGKKQPIAPAPLEEASALPVVEPAQPLRIEAQVQAPSAASQTQAKPEHRSFLRKIGQFFGAIFR